MLLAIEEQKNQLVYNVQSGKFQTILRLDCRNIEPVSFNIKSVQFIIFFMFFIFCT